MNTENNGGLIESVSRDEKGGMKAHDIRQEGKERREVEFSRLRNIPKRLYSLPEAAHYLGRTTWSIRKLIWAGRLPIVRDGRRIFVDINDLNAYIEKNKATYV